jgi:hypothetical protein
MQVVVDSPFSKHEADANDVLYANDEEYMSELQTICDTLLEEITADLVSFSSCVFLTLKASMKAASQSLDLLNRLLNACQLNAATATLAFDLFQMSKRNASVADAPYVRNTLSYIKRLGAKKGRLYFELCNRLMAS